MEGLLIALLIGVLTSFMNKKEDKKASPTKPFIPQKELPPVETTQAQGKLAPRKSARPKIETKSLDDFARDVMTQLSTKEQAAPLAPKQTDTMELRQSLEERMKDRQQAVRAVEARSDALEFPTSYTQMQQAIIMAEVLGKPKAKQRA
ncbi:hypothetical protein [Caryophanon latum]|uniref:Uncharacterized protein n=1 Tax=Caryophanon latum TaxID=33977 RepID=A0A1C0Z505_9BACL|nr:hypothetical protein [Caryophanon latum]OCS94599.1 hypothetical protein A6K76_00050 [Caryophanon latum]